MIKLAIDIPRESLAEFCRRNSIQRLALFGSVLRDDFCDDSDLDVLVEFAPGVRIGLRFFSLQQELTDLLGIQVDLQTPGFLSKHFRDDVLNEAEVLYESP